IEFYLFRDSYDQLHDKGYRNLLPHSPFMEDYQIVQTTRDEYVVGEIRRGLEAAAIPVEFSKGEAGRGQHEINLSYTRALSVAFPALTPTRISRLLARLRRVSMAFAIVCNSMTHIPVTGMKRRICHAFPPHWLRPPTCGNTVRLRANVLATTCTIICSPWRGTNGRVFNKPSPIGSVCATSSAPNP
ncbi:MAG: hypothetical protein EBY79_05955, partial [Actinobacteria bacterium]|nr:hypothetical protein [Actinomycetota bacterium]